MLSRGHDYHHPKVQHHDTHWFDVEPRPGDNIYDEYVRDLVQKGCMDTVPFVE
jgi:hypothetical protein